MLHKGVSEGIVGTHLLFLERCCWELALNSPKMTPQNVRVPLAYQVQSGA